jgi:predicted deacetylase
MTVLVTIHDVTPRFASEVETLLAFCERADIRPALLVVPDYHGNWPIERYPDFCARLRELQSCGHEIYLHGYYHQSAREDPDAVGLPSRGAIANALRTLTKPARARYAQRWVSAGEAEFSDISPELAARKLNLGRNQLESIGLRLDGFVAPAWSMSHAILPLLANHGLHFTEDHFRIYDPVIERSRLTLLINYATRTLTRLAVTAAFARAGRVAAPLLPVRVALHPADLTSRLLNSEVPKLLAWAAVRGVVTPRTLLNRE